MPVLGCKVLQPHYTAEDGRALLPQDQELQDTDRPMLTGQVSKAASPAPPGGFPLGG